MLPTNFFIGLGIFLYGMSSLELGMKNLSFYSLKKWLFKLTSTSITSVLFGIITTAILQSSSMMSLIVLVLANANLIPLYNAVGVLLGANLGTTLTGWVVATIGFKLNIKYLALPFIAIYGFSERLFKAKKKFKAIATILLGLGLLLLGLSLMNQSLATLPSREFLKQIVPYGKWSFLVVGMTLTIIIQSSSATMILALAALNAHLIHLTEAAALIIGADLATTSTTIFASLSGTKIEKQLALSHVVFNLVTDLLAFFILLPFLPELLRIAHINDPLLSLVAFHSFFNIIGLCLFIPILKCYSHWLGSFFNNTYSQEIKIDTTIPEVAIISIKKYSHELYTKAITLNLNILQVPSSHQLVNSDEYKRVRVLQSNSYSLDERYDDIKKSESLISQAVLKLQQQVLPPQMVKILEQSLYIIRGIIYSSKTLKDISHDLEQLKREHSQLCKELYSHHCQYHCQLYSKIITLLDNHSQSYFIEKIEELNQANDKHYDLCQQLVYQQYSHSENLLLLSSLLNINHEVHHSAKNLLKTIIPWSKLNKESIAEEKENGNFAL